MSILDNFTQKVTETAKAAAKKSGEIVEITKLNINIASETDEISKKWAEIGKAIYESFENNREVPEYVIDYCKEIQDLKSIINEMKQKILEFKNVKLCEGCDSKIDIKFEYCPKCGAKQGDISLPSAVTPEKNTESMKERLCPNCNLVVNDSDSHFCPSCGTKID